MRRCFCFGCANTAETPSFLTTRVAAGAICVHGKNFKNTCIDNQVQLHACLDNPNLDMHVAKSPLRSSVTIDQSLTLVTATATSAVALVQLAATGSGTDSSRAGTGDHQ